jgi:hypothetical protein
VDAKGADVNTQLKQSWIAALRSGRYLQGRGFLRERSIFGRSYFCAMGVLLDLIATPAQWARLTRGTARAGILDEAYGYLPAEICGEIGLSNTQQAFIAGLNDYGRTFEEIAEVVERDFEDEACLRATAGRLTGGLFGTPVVPPSTVDWNALAGLKPHVAWHTKQTMMIVDDWY